MRRELLSGGLMATTNLTHPGQAPVAGDEILIDHGNGVTEKKFYTPPPDSIEPVDPCAELIDIGPFFDRFGAHKIPILADPDAVVQAIIKDVMSRKWIHLTRPDVAQAVDTIIAKGHAVTKSAILATPVAAVDNLALRKLFFS